MDNKRKLDPVILRELGKHSRFFKIGCNTLSLMKKMIYSKKKLQLIFAPAAAVIRREQALFGMIGRKEFVDGKKFIF